MLTLIPAMVLGQLPVNNAENYNLGTVLKYQGCYAKGLTGGNAGVNQLWDYSTLQSCPKDVITVWVDSVRSNDYGKYFPEANRVKIFSDGRFVFINSTKEANYLVGYVDTVHDTKSVFPDPQLLIKRPLKYKTMAVDTFYRKVTMQAFKKKVKMNYPYYYLAGVVYISADGYGQLKLPWGTYNNVIRLKIVQSTGDSVNFSTPLINDVTSYAWYDNRHSGFLFRIDSSRSGSETMISAQYLISETNERSKKK